ncbi:MAG: GNAT family N-acetyltransferase [Lachnospiraceae bacterium]|nr:GNAT family N-acetyltransferase [Lachnospiraceae bacterium]
MNGRFRVFGLTSPEMAEPFRGMLPQTYDYGDGNYLLGAVDEAGNPCGVCWYQFGGLYYEVLFLGVHPEYRRQGAGTELLRTFLGSLYEMHTVFPVRLSFIHDDSSGDFYHFLTSQGNFILSKPDRLYCISPEERGKSSLWQSLGKNRLEAVSFFELPEKVRREFVARQHKMGYWFFMEEDITGDAYEKELSFCTLRNNSVEAALFMKKINDEVNEVAYLYGDIGLSEHLMKTLSATVKAIDRLCPEKALQIKVVNAQSEKLVHKFFPGVNEYTTIENVIWDFSVV